MSCRISELRTLDVKIVDENNNVLYEGMVDDTPENMKCLSYKKIEIGKQTILYV